MTFHLYYHNIMNISFVIEKYKNRFINLDYCTVKGLSITRSLAGNCGSWYVISLTVTIHSLKRVAHGTLFPGLKQYTYSSKYYLV